MWNSSPTHRGLHDCGCEAFTVTKIYVLWQCLQIASAKVGCVQTVLVPAKSYKHTFYRHIPPTRSTQWCVSSVMHSDLLHSTHWMTLEDYQGTKWETVLKHRKPRERTTKWCELSGYQPKKSWYTVIRITPTSRRVVCQWGRQHITSNSLQQSWKNNKSNWSLTKEAWTEECMVHQLYSSN